MTLGAILGLAALNGAYAALGITVLWAIRGLARWTDVLRLAGLAYLLGVAPFGILWTQLLVFDVRFSGWGAVLSLIGGIVAAAGVGVLVGRPLPRGYGDPNRHASSGAVLVTAGGVALTGLLLEALFRSARLQSLQAYDAWAFWIPKAKAIYFFGDLDQHVFTTFPDTDVPAARSDHRRGGVSRDGRRGRRHVAPAVLVPRRRARLARSPGCLYGQCRHGCSGRRWCSSSPCRASRRDCWPLRRTCSSTSCSSSGRLLLALWCATGAGGASPRPPCCSPVRG